MPMATPTVVLLPVWGAGHLMPMLEAGRRLLASGGGGRALSVTVLVMRPPTEQDASDLETDIGRRAEEAAAGGLDVRFHFLPAVAPSPDCAGPVEFISRVVQLHAPHVRAAVSSLAMARPVAALVLDLFCTPLVDVARELAVPAYVYFTCNAAALSFFLRLPALCEEVAGEFAEMHGAADIPGLPPVPSLSLPAPIMERKTPECSSLLLVSMEHAQNGMRKASKNPNSSPAKTVFSPSTSSRCLSCSRSSAFAAAFSSPLLFKNLVCVLNT